MAIKKLAIGTIVVQDGQLQAKVFIRGALGEFVSSFAFDLSQNPEISNAALALDHEVRKAIHEELGMDAPEFKPLHSKILAPN